MKILYYHRNDQFLLDGNYSLKWLLFYYYEYKKAIRMNLYPDKLESLIRRHKLVGQLVLQKAYNPPPYDDVICL